jgi:tetratricopeptide (TPR) repeat protein
VLAVCVVAVTWGAMPVVLSASSGGKVTQAAESTPKEEIPSRHCAVEHFVATAADQAFVMQDYAKAESLYRAMLARSPEMAAAGVARSELGQWKLDEALGTVEIAVALQPKSAMLTAVLGEVRLQRGELDESTAAFNRALQLDPCYGRVHADMARQLRLEGMFATAQRNLDTAHELSPDDSAIGEEWAKSHATPLTMERRIDRLKEQLQHEGLSETKRTALNSSIKALQSRERGDCVMVTAFAPTTLKMKPISKKSEPVYAMGLEVDLNGHKSLLKLDTGASGLLISQAAAKNAGLVAEAEIKTGGIGDDGPADTYVTHVEDIKIGAMEFRNCMVRVLEQPDALDVDGLIGSDVFRRYLVTLDMPGLKLGLAALPKIPEETAEGEIALNTTGENAGTTTQTVLHDRYIAPEMKDWTKIYRMEHELIFPTKIGSGPTKLFILDSGTSRGLISQEAAREVTELWSDGRTQVRGISGNVSTSYRAANVSFQFAGVQQLSQRMTAIDTSDVSRRAGVEIGGFVGFPTMRELVITIDYRDNLAHVVYDPKHSWHGR